MTGSVSLLLRLAGLTGAGAVIAGCAAGTSSSAPPQPESSASTTVAAPSSSAASAAASSAASAPAASATASPASSAQAVAAPSAGAPGCATRDLQAKVGISQGAAGSVYQVIDFTNIGNAACTLYGYPGVSLASGTPVTQVGQPASRSPIAGPT